MGSEEAGPSGGVMVRLVGPDSVAGLVCRICYVEASRGAHDVCEFDARAITETDAAIAEVSALDLAYH